MSYALSQLGTNERANMRDLSEFDLRKCQYSVRTELFESIRHPEDGERMIGEAVFLCITAPSGSRFQKLVGAMDYRVSYTDDGCGVERTADLGELLNTAEAIAWRLRDIASRREPHINTNEWDYVGAVYGSDDYQRDDLEEIHAQQERAEGWNETRFF